MTSYLCSEAFLFGCTCADAPLVVFVDDAENLQKELQEFRAAAQTVVESMGSAEDSEGSLADRLRVVPRKFAEYLAEASRNCVAQALGLVKSYWPWAKIGVLGDVMCSTCDHDQFVKFVEEAEPLADQIVKLVDQ